MKNFLKNILLFVVPIVVGTIFIEVYLRTSNSMYLEKKKGLDECIEDVEILVLGNSHVHYGVDPNQFEFNVYNAAMLGQTLYYDKEILKKYIKKAEKLRYVILNVSYQSLYKPSMGVRNSLMYYSYGIKYRENKTFQYDLSYFWFGYEPKASYILLNNDLQNYRSGRKFNNDFSIEKGVANIKMKNGWLPFENDNQTKFTELDIKKKAKRANFSVKNESDRDLLIEDIEDLIQILIDEKIQPIIVTMPCYKPYIEQLDKKIIIKNEFEINRIKEKYSLEYWNLFSEIKDKKYFFNADHLNKRGAEKVSKLLNKRIKDL